MTTAKRINELTDPKYIKIPPSTSDMWATTEPLDAGTMMILENNINHCSYESCKQLFTTLNSQLTINQDNPSDDTLNDFVSTTDSDPTNDISWSMRTAFRFGPFLSPFDERQLMLKLHIYNAGVSELLIGISYNASRPIPPTDPYTFQTISLTDIGESIETVVLYPSNIFILNPEFEPFNNFYTDSVNGNASSEISKLFYYVWVGMLADNNSSNIVSISGFETRGA